MHRTHAYGAANLTLEKEHHQQWEAIFSDWRDLVCQSTLAKFKSFLSSPSIQDPPGICRLKEQLSAEQRNIKSHILAILDKVKSLAPPTATQSLVHEWQECTRKLHQQMGEGTYRDCYMHAQDHSLIFNDLQRVSTPATCYSSRAVMRQ